VRHGRNPEGLNLLALAVVICISIDAIDVIGLVERVDRPRISIAVAINCTF